MVKAKAKKLEAPKTPSLMGVDYKGKYLVLKSNAVKPQYRTPENMVVLANGGFGCDPQALGTKVFVSHMDGEDGQFWRNSFERLATDEEIALFKSLHDRARNEEEEFLKKAEDIKKLAHDLIRIIDGELIVDSQKSKSIRYYLDKMAKLGQ